MDTTTGAWAAIGVTALVTYLLRISGYWLMARVPVTPRVRRGLDALPGAIFVATVAPHALKAGAPGVVAVMATGLVMVVTRKELPALAVGFVTAAAMRSVGM